MTSLHKFVTHTHTHIKCCFAVNDESLLLSMYMYVCVEAQGEVGESTGDGREVQTAKIDLMGDDEGDSPLPGQVPLTDPAPDDAEPEFRQPHSRGHVEEDQIQLQEEPILNYNYGETSL